MQCPFCQQWNPADAPDCAFCGNELRSPVDATLEGRPAYEGGAAGRAAAIDRQAAALAHSGPPEPEPFLSPGVVRGIVDVVGGGPRSIAFMVGALILSFLLYKLFSC